jgi:hypothetical protein
MPTYRITGPDGTKYKIDGPKGATREQVIGAIQYRLAEAEDAAPVEPQDTDNVFENIYKGLGAGFVNTLENSALGLAALLDEGAELTARDAIKGVADSVRPVLANPEDVSAKLAQGVGSVLGFAPALLTGPAAPYVAGTIALSGGAGEASERARAADATEEQRGQAALLGTIPGAFDVIPLARLSRRLGPDVVGELVNKFGKPEINGIGSRLRRAAGTGGIEGAQEIAQGIAQNLIERGYNEDAELLKGTGEEGLIGAGTGAIVQGLLDAFVGRGARKGGPSEPAQGKLFGPDDDLGGGPTLTEGQEQGELFPSSTVTERDPDMARLADDLRAEEAAADSQESMAGRKAQYERRDIGQLQGSAAPRADIENEILARRDIIMEEAGFADEARTVPVISLEAATRRARLEAEEARYGRVSDPGQLTFADEVLRQESPVETQEAVAEARKEEFLNSPPADTEAELRRAIEGEATTPMAVAAREALERGSVPLDTTRSATERRQQEEAVRQQTEAEIAEFESAAVEPEVAVIPEAAPEVAPEVEELTQDTLPGLGRNYGEKVRQERIDARPEPTPEPRILGEQVLDNLAIKKTAPVRKRIIGKDFNDPEIRQRLVAFAKNPLTSQAARFNIGRLINGTPEEQMDLFPPRQKSARRSATEAKSIVTPAPVEDPSVAPDLDSLDAVTAGFKGPVARVAKTETETETETETKPDPDSVDAVSDAFVEPIPRVAKKAAPKKTVAKKAAPKKAAPKKTVAKPEAKEAAPKKSLETRVDEDGNTVTLVPEGLSGKKKRKSSPKSKQLEIEVGERADLKFFTEAQPTWVRREITSTDADVAKVDALVRSKRTRAEQRKESTVDANKSGARKYFGRKDDPIEALDDIIYDLVYGPPTGSYRLGSMEREGDAAYTEAEQSYFEGRGKPAAREALSWVRDNLDPTTVKSMNDLIAVELWGVKSGKFANLDPDADVDVLDVSVSSSPMSRAFIEADEKQIKSYVDAQLDENLDYLDGINVEETITENDLKDLLLESGQVVGLDLPTHPVINNLLRAGKLKEALRTLAITSPSKRVSQVASKLAQKLGDTKVEVVENLTNDAGKPAAGLFDPKTNTIKIDAATGINPHTILHETTHALTSATLANKSHPATKQLEKLFDDVKDELGSYYGSQNVDEFASEAFGNPDFQRELSRIYPNGSPISALQRFFNTVGNFVRRMLGMQTKPAGSALNEADKFVEAMLAPAPDSRDVGSLYLKASEIMDGLNKVGKSFPQLTPAYRKRWANSAHNFLSVDNPARKLASTILLASAPLQALTDVATRYGIKSSFKLHVAIQTLVGKQALAEARVDGTLKSMGKWLHGSSTTDAKRQSFNNLIYDSTTEQVDPYALESKYAGNKKKLAVWKAMRGDVSIVGTGGRDTYIELRDSYKSQFEELQRVIGGRIDALRDENGDPLAKEAREKLKANVFDKIFAKGRIEPYFPLTRQGDLWLEFNTKVTTTDKDGKKVTTTEPVYMAFRTDYERKQFIASLKNNKDVVGTPVPYKNMKSAITGARGNAPSTSFINQTMGLLKGVDADVQNQFMELFLNALPESSFARSMVSRGNQGKGQLGFDTDAESAFRSKAYNLASQIERMRHSQNIDDVMAEIENETKAISKAGKAGAGATMATFEELQKRAAFAKNPPSDKIAASFNRVAFLGTIGFNVSSAIVNMSQIPLMMQPLLGGTYGQKNAAKALFHASALISGSAKYGRKMTTMLGKEADAKGMPSIDNYYQEIQTLDADKNPVFTLKIRDDLKLDAAKRKELEELMPLVQMAASQGQLSRSLFYDTLGVELSGREKGAWDYTNAWSAFMFHQVERANRQIALVSTYQLELARLKAKGGMTDAAMQDAAAQTAIYKSQEMNGGAFLATAPRIAQSDVGRVAMMYKTFGIQMYYTILKTGKAAFSDADPEIRKQAMKQLVGVLGSSALLAGVQGLPMIGAVFALANLFLDDDEEDAETITRQFMREGFYKGGVNALTGLDVANRFGLGNLLFRMNPYSQNQSNADIAAQIIGGPAWSVGSQFVRGLSDASSGELQRGIETMLPSAFRNVAKTIRYGEEGAIKSRRGDIIYDDISSGELMGQLFGFAPTGYTLQQEKNMSTKKIDRAVNERRTGVLRKLYIALRMNDSSGYEDALEELQDFNRRHPSFILTVDSVKKSLLTHERTSATMYNGITISPKMRGVLQEHRDSYSE